jgi:hypothetical protein
MQNKDKKYFIPVDGNPIEVSEEVYRAYYQPIWNTRYHAQQNGECRCTKAQLWKCDGVCPGCPFYAAGKKVSIDTPIGGEDDELNVSTFTIPKDELYEWADQVLAPTAELSFNGDGEYHCGEWCQFCKAKADCRERANANMELAKFEFRQPPLLTDEEVEEILGRIDELIAWASDIKDYALQAAISGKQWSGYKLIEGRSNRKYTDENAVIAAVTAAGYDPYEHKILGVTAMTSLLGKKQFNDILGGLITKPQGKPTLVPGSDKRPAMTTIIDDFKEDN